MTHSIRFGQFNPRRSWGVVRAAVSLVVLLTLIAAARAFNPPVDTAGPLTVRIEGPEEVTQVETPVAVRVVVENKGSEAVKGTVELTLIDAWRAEPAAPVPFSVGSQGSTALEFKIIAGKPTYDALYPIHALARFEVGGKSLVAHPILIFDTKIVDKSAKRPWHQMELILSETKSIADRIELPWQPFRVAGDGLLALWQLPVRRAIVEVPGAKPVATAVGWEGSASGVDGYVGVEKASVGKGSKESIVMRPPVREGRAGAIAAEFPLELPKTTPIQLALGNGVEHKGSTGGATFRVRVLPIDAPAGELGEVVFEQKGNAEGWQPGGADLSRFAGQSIRLQLESCWEADKEASEGLLCWAEPMLVAGKPASQAAFPPKGAEGSQVLGTIERGDQKYEVRIWPGTRGLLDSTIGFAAGTQALLFRGFHIRVLETQLDDPRAPISLEKVDKEPAGEAYQVRHHFRSVFGDFDVVGRLWLEKGVLRVKFQLENGPAARPWLVVYLEDVAAGSWTSKVEQIYAGPGNVIRRPETFDGPFEGHALSTSMIGMDFDNGMSLVQAVDVPPTGFGLRPAIQHCSLHVANDCQLTFIPTANVWEGVSTWHDTNGLEAAGGVETAAGRFVFDLWGGEFASAAEEFERAFRYGVTDAMVVWHRWQRWGYDYRLPEIYPPNPKVGTVEQMRALVATCKKAGVPFAPHDNYVDFYPDADGFSYEKVVAFSSKDRPVRAWLNEGRGAQSYRYRADCIERFLQPNVELLRKNIGPTAYFIDVWSSLPPYAYWTPEGKFNTKIYTRDVIRKQFAWIRDQLGGKAPQISESGHDQLIGFLDGAQTNHLRVEVPRADGQNLFVWPVVCEDAERTPWFDAAHHDRFVLHGAGYPSRYRGGLDARLHGNYSDDYIATEVLTGHPGMVGDVFNRDVVRKYWLTSDLMRALALRRIEGVEYVDGNLHRQHVRWSGGGEVWVNRGKDDWKVAGAVLPQYGFVAKVPTEQGTVGAAICRRQGVITEWAYAPKRLYVNGRQANASSKEFAGTDGQAFLARQNATGKPIAFGPLATCGGCRLMLDGENLVVIPLPQSEGSGFAFAIRWKTLPWKLAEPTKVEAIDESGKVLSLRPIARDGQAVIVQCEPGVFQYRLVRK